MKRFLFSIFVLVAILMIVGTVGDMYLHSEHGYVNYQKKLADKDSIILELRESIEILNDKADMQQVILDYFKLVDSAMVEDAIHHIWNVREIECVVLLYFRCFLFRLQPHSLLAIAARSFGCSRSVV